MIKNFIILVLSFVLCSSFCQSQMNIKESESSKYYVTFINGALPIRENGKWGIVDSNNVVKVKIEYDSLYAAGKGMCILKKDNKHFLVNENFQFLYEFADCNVSFVHPNLLKIKPLSGDLFYVALEGKTKVLKTYKEKELYVKLQEFVDRYKKENPQGPIIDSIDIEGKGDTCFLIIHYRDGDSLVSERSKEFEQILPYYIVYYTSGSNEQKVLNLKTKEINSIKKGNLDFTISIGDSLYQVIKHSIHCEVINVNSDKGVKTKLFLESFGELLISYDTYNKNSYEVYHLTKRKLLYSNLSKVTIKKDYIYCIDTLNTFKMLNSKGEEFYSGDNGLIKGHDKFIKDDNYDELTEEKLIVLTTIEDKDIVISTSGRIFYNGNFRIVSSGGNAIRILGSNLRTVDCGYIDYQKGTVGFFRGFEEIKFLRSELFACKIQSSNIKTNLWIVCNQKGQLMINKRFEYIKIFKRDIYGDYIIVGSIGDTIYFFDKNNKLIDTKFDNTFHASRITTKDENWKESDLYYFQLIDSNAKLGKMILDENFNVIYEEDFKYVCYNPIGEYFFVFTPTGEMGYIRKDGTKLF